MSFLPQPQIDELKVLCFLSDKEIRSDLILGIVVSENDYTSNFTGALRRNINSYSITGLRASSQLLNPVDERATGCDAAIVIAANGQSKILLIEGKWPRLSTPGYPWDSKQASTGSSHFSDQLGRQSSVAHRYAITEMFFNEYPFGVGPVFMQAHGSSCIWHSDALAFDPNRPTYPKVWTQSELVSLLSSGTHGIADVIEQVCLCNEGVPMTLPSSLRLDLRDFPLPANVLLITAGDN